MFILKDIWGLKIKMANETFDLTELIERCRESNHKQERCFLNDALGNHNLTCKYQSEKKMKNYIDEKGKTHFDAYYDCLKGQKCQ